MTGGCVRQLGRCSRRFNVRISNDPRVLVELAEVGKDGVGRVDGRNKPTRSMKSAHHCTMDIKVGTYCSFCCTYAAWTSLDIATLLVDALERLVEALDKSGSDWETLVGVK